MVAYWYRPFTKKNIKGWCSIYHGCKVLIPPTWGGDVMKTYYPIMAEGEG
jgi:hypothetical protein